MELMKNGRSSMALDLRRVLMGAFLTIAFGLCAIIVGNAIGLSSYNVTSTTAGGGMRAVSWIYSVATLVAAFYSGSFAAARIATPGRSRDPVLHGLAIWAITGVSLAVYGFAFSTTARSVIAGTAANGANWMVVFTAVLGASMSIVGARRGASSMELIDVHHDEDHERTGMAA